MARATGVVDDSGIRARTVPTSSVSVLAALRTIVREEGVRALYRGWSAAVLRAFPANAALFWGQTVADRALRNVGI